MDIGGEGGLPPGDVDQNEDQQPSSNLNISDVIEAISIADPSFAEAAEPVLAVPPEPALARVAEPMLADAMARQSPPHGGPYVRIVEQPACKALRFRYECEGRSAGSIPGVNNTADRRTYPTIEICGHTGKAIVVVSCVTREEPHRPHPHNLVGRDRCRSGVCTVRTDLTENSLVSFSNLGIQCVKRRDIAEALRVREGLRVDPFRTGFAHMHQPQSIDLNAVRLCFQVFLVQEGGQIRHSLPPVVSDVIYDKKAMSDLQILRISRPSGSAKGGTEVILLCEKVTREDIAVVMVEERRDQQGVIWEESANIIVVHKQVAIAFTTPAYRLPNTGDHVEVQIQLKRVSDNARSNSIPFTYIPDFQDALKRKRQKTISSSLLQQIEQESAKWNQEQMPIKAEPSGATSPLPMGGSPMPMRGSPIPMGGSPMPMGGSPMPMGGSPMPMGGSPMPMGGSPHYTTLEQVPDNQYQQQWIPEALSVAGPSTMASPPFYTQDMAWPAAPSYGQNMPQTMHPNMSPNMQPRSPIMHPVMGSPMHAVSPQQVVSPSMAQPIDERHGMPPAMGHMSPRMGHVSPNLQAMSPQQVMSPHMGQAMDDRQCGVSPGMEHMNPNMHVMGHATMQQQQQMESNTSISLTNLLAMNGGEPMQQFNSGEISDLLRQMQRSNDLSDSMNRLSTSDLLNYQAHEQQ